jgi:hypothetical protein
VGRRQWHVPVPPSSLSDGLPRIEKKKEGGRKVERGMMASLSNKQVPLMAAVRYYDCRVLALWFGGTAEGEHVNNIRFQEKMYDCLNCLSIIYFALNALHSEMGEIKQETSF